MKKVLIGFIAVMASLVSCKKSGNAFETATSDTLTYEIKKFEKKSDNCVKEDSLCATVRFEYPFFKNETLDQQVQTDLIAIFQDSSDSTVVPAKKVEDLAEPFIKEYAQTLAEGKNYAEDANEKNPGGFFVMPWIEEASLKVDRQTDTYLMLKANTNWFKGGAHPISMEYYFVYNRETLKRVKLEDLFEKGFDQKLLAIAEKQFRVNENLKPNEPLDDLHGYFFENAKFILNDNFTLTPKGLKFLYNVYEIKAYAFGVTELEISYEDLKGILKK